ncbi:sulfatase-like hydrolase/transferase [candidate division KSB1 bacterium]|nr:sulfatase-like hydrolase/transferase [candidate division KSB1 bacterium]
MKKQTRRDFIKTTTAGSIALAMMGATGFAQSKNKKKNVLFIAIDDLRPQLNCYGETQIISPNIDKLSQSGMAFTNAFCQHATCGASRASLLTGLRDDSTGIIGLHPKVSDALPDQLTLPQNFEQHGYETVSLGKIYHHADDDLKGWSVKPWRAADNFFGRGYVTEEAKNIVIQRRRKKQYGYWIVEDPNATKGPATEMADVPYNGYSDGQLADKAVEELQRCKKSDKPFFLAVGFRKPHLPFCAPKKFWDMYSRDEIDLADNPFFPKGHNRYSMNGMGELESYTDTPEEIKEGDLDEKTARRLIHGYYACVSYIDFCLGLILAELDRLKLRENTIVVLWGDHGWKLGEHGAWAKHTNFEVDTKVPLIIDVPGMKAEGQKSEALVELVDIYPTLCDLCGLSKPDNLEGYSFAPLTNDPDKEWKKAIFSQYPRSRNNADTLIMGNAMRTHRYRYVEWVHVKSGEVRARELYDRQKDPQENINVIDDTAYADAAKEMASMLKKGWKGALPQ